MAYLVAGFLTGVVVTLWAVSLDLPRIVKKLSEQKGAESDKKTY